MAALVAVSWAITAPSAHANEYSCANAAAANGYVNASKFLWQVEQDCAVAYKIANPGVSTQAEGAAALAAAEQYLRSLGYDAATVEQMDIAGHGI
jgi:hypothetical protein